MSNAVQNYKNHRRMEPATYYILLPLNLVVLAGIVTAWISYADLRITLWEALLASSAGIALFTVSMKARSFAIIAQDRAIRAEETLRYFILTGQRLPNGLSNAQIIALRFASDEEVVSLVKRAVNESLTANQIKQAIQTWRADTHRV